jgi:leader peptidase (prepilin peptidase)/N-methyltransferase
MSLIYVYVIVWIALFAWASFIDFKSFILPDLITLPLILSGVLFNTFSANSFCSSTDSLLGSLIGYALIRLVDECYFKLKKQRGIGQGDAKLLAAIGAILGWQTIFPILCFASILGVIVGLSLMKFKRSALENKIPFGPFLSFFACAFILERVLSAGP